MARKGTSDGKGRLSGRQCAGCGKAIQSGLYCSKCLEKFREKAKLQGRLIEALKRSDLQKAAEERNEISVMIINNDERNLNLTKTVLERGLPEYKILTANNPLTAINMLVSRVINLVILDADYNGIDMLERLRRDDRFQKLPIMIMSGSTEREVVANVFSLGVQDYVTKPCAPKNLITRVNKLLNVDAKKNAPPPPAQDGQRAAFQILLVDDDIFDLRHERQLLQNRFPCKITTVQSAAEGMKILENSSVDLVLVSLDMPFINGLKFVALLQNNPKLRNIPVIIMTDTRDFTVISEIERSPAAAHIRKPNINEDGFARIEQVLRGRKR